MKKIVKKIYNLLPFKKGIFNLLKQFKFRESIYKHLYFNGPFKVKIDDVNKFSLYHHGLQIENEIFWEGLFGKYERASIKIWSILSKDSKIIFDVGANTGIYALTAKATNPNSEVFAFEPIKRVYDKLVLNNKINGFDIHCQNVALSECNGKILVFDQPHTHETTVSLERNILEDSENSMLVEIDRVNLESFILSNSIDIIDLIKLDVEYHEYSVLFGMGEYLHNFRPNILIEIVDEQIAQKIDSLIKGLNYVFYDINDSSFSIKKLSKLTKSTQQNLLIYRAENEDKLLSSLSGIVTIL